jgi:hypothetical protein
MSDTGQAKRGRRAVRVALVVFGAVFALFGLVAAVLVLWGAERAEPWSVVVPVLFALVGGGIVMAGLRAGEPRAPATGAQVAAEADPVAGLPAGARVALATRTLKPSASPWARLVGGLLFTLLWNALIASLVAGAVNGWLAGQRPYFHSVFVLPFVAVGLGGAGFVVHALLLLFNPRVRLRVSPGTLRLGERAQVDWEVVGAAHRLRKLTLTLEGREEATYRRGTDTRTDRQLFARVPVVEHGAGGPRRGSERIAVPAETMHTFEASHNKVVWLLRVHGEIRRWPNVNDEFPLVVLPRGERV